MQNSLQFLKAVSTQQNVKQSSIKNNMKQSSELTEFNAVQARNLKPESSHIVARFEENFVPPTINFYGKSAKASEPAIEALRTGKTKVGRENRSSSDSFEFHDVEYQELSVRGVLNQGMRQSKN